VIRSASRLGVRVRVIPAAIGTSSLEDRVDADCDLMTLYRYTDERTQQICTYAKKNGVGRGGDTLQALLTINGFWIGYDRTAVLGI
jgi:hypothetical protein